MAEDTVSQKIEEAAKAAAQASQAAGGQANPSDMFARATAAAGVDRVTDGKVMEVGGQAIAEAKPDASDQSAAIGKAMWVLLHSPIHKHMFITELEWMLLPPIAMKQYRIWQRGGVPVAYACWAHLSDDAEAALKAGVRRVAPEAWASGENLWLIDAVVPFGGRDEVLATLKQEVFGTRKVRSLQPAPGGGLGVVEW